MTGTRLSGRWLLLARVAWLAIAIPTLTFSVGGFVVAFGRPELAGLPVIDLVLTQAGIPLRLALLIFLLPLMLVSSITALVIFWRRSDDWMALFFAMALLSLGATLSRSLNALGLAYSVLRATVSALENLSIVLVILAVYLFPNGRVVPRWARLSAALTLLVPILFSDLPDVMMAVPNLPEGLPAWRLGLMALLVLGTLGTGLLSQVYRYRYVSGPVERQQTKWVLVSLASAFLAMVGLMLWSYFWEAAEWYGWSMLAFTFVVDLFPISVAVAVLRYRLWDVDVLINRALVYSLLTATLGALYWGSVVLLQQVLRPLTQGSDLAIIGSTLAVAGLFQPARHRIQDAVDRRYFRRRYDAARTLEIFSARLRADVDLDSLRVELLAVVQRTMLPASASLWLRPPRRDHS
jgi:hypothetical protein